MDEYTKALELKVKQLEESCKYLNQQLEYNNYYRREKELNEFMSAPDFKKRIEEFVGLKEKIKELEIRIAESNKNGAKTGALERANSWMSKRIDELESESNKLKTEIKELNRKADEYRRVIDELFVVEPRQHPDESEFVPPL